MSFYDCQIVGIGMSADAYHDAKNSIPRGDARRAMSPSGLNEFRRNPRRWMKGYKSPESESKKFGNALDMLLLTPDGFFAKYAVRPDTYEDIGYECPQCKSVTSAKTCGKCKLTRRPIAIQKEWNNNSTVCQEWIEQHPNREILSQSEMTGFELALARIKEDETVSKFIAACDKQVLIRGKWRSEKTGLSIPVECLIDLFGREDGAFPGSNGDCKCVRNGASEPFKRQVFNLGWHLQAAFDTDMAIAATQRDFHSWHFVGVENYEPFEPFRKLMGQDFLDGGRLAYKHALELYAMCIATNKWPGYDDSRTSDDPNNVGGWSIIRPEPWMAYEEMSQAMEQDQAMSEAPELEDVNV